MKRRILLVLLMVFVCLSSGLVLAKDTDEKKESATPQKAQETTPSQLQADVARQEKEMLIANINNMRNQELRVAVLQQLLNEESARLLNTQAVFCDRYKLDVEKWRKGLYRYDEKQAKFIEQPPQ